MKIPQSELELRALLEQVPLVNPYYTSDLFQLLEGQSRGLEVMEEADRLCFAVASGICQNRQLVAMQSDSGKIMWYDYMGLQVYLFLKGKGSYQDKKSAALCVNEAVLCKITSDVCAYCGMESDLLPLVASLMLCVAEKLVAEAWCDYFYHTKIKNNEGLKQLLEEKNS